MGGLIIQGVSAVTIVAMFTTSGPFGMFAAYCGRMMGTYYTRALWFGWMGGLWLINLAAVVGLGLFGLLWMNSRDAERIRGGAVLVLVGQWSRFPPSGASALAQYSCLPGPFSV